VELVDTDKRACEDFVGERGGTAFDNQTSFVTGKGVGTWHFATSVSTSDQYAARSPPYCGEGCSLYSAFRCARCLRFSRRQISQGVSSLNTNLQITLFGRAEAIKALYSSSCSYSCLMPRSGSPPNPSQSSDRSMPSPISTGLDLSLHL